MQPYVHLAVGYLCYAWYCRWRYDRVPGEGAVLVTLLGAAVPDLVDQSLAATGATSVTRRVGHSLLFGGPLVAAVGAVSIRRGRRVLGVAFAIGYLTHLAADAPWHLLAGDFHELGYLLWPITDMPPYSGVKSLGSLGGVDITTLWLEVVVLAAGIVRWIRDGTPGLGSIRARIGT